MRPHLSEFQRRLWLGAEAADWGRGGSPAAAQATGVAADTVRRGRKEADAGIGPGTGRSRRAGGGRKRAEAHDEKLLAAFELLIDPVTRGDPMSPLRWTSKSIRALTRALRTRVTTSATSWSAGCCGNGATACRPTPRPPRAGNISTGTPSSPTSTIGPPTTWLPGTGDQRRHQEEGAGGPTETVAGSGSPKASRSRSRSTTSSTPRWARPTRTGSTTWGRTPGGWRWAPTTTPPRSRSTPSEHGGTMQERTCTPTLPDC